jgi:hypothetical protein
MRSSTARILPSSGIDWACEHPDRWQYERHVGRDVQSPTFRIPYQTGRARAEASGSWRPARRIVVVSPLLKPGAMAFGGIGAWKEPQLKKCQQISVGNTAHLSI